MSATSSRGSSREHATRPVWLENCGRYSSPSPTNRSRGCPMSEVLILAHEDVKRLLPMDECIELMAEALGDLARGRSWQPLRFVVRPPEEQSLMGLMPAHRSSPEPAYGLKTVCIFPGNPSRGLAPHQGGGMRFEGGTGERCARVAAASVTGAGTGATSAEDQQAHA